MCSAKQLLRCNRALALAVMFYLSGYCIQVVFNLMNQMILGNRRVLLPWDWGK